MGLPHFWHMHACGRCRIPSIRRSYWLVKLQRNRHRDQLTRRKLRALGYDILTIWECQTRDPVKLTQRFARFLNFPPTP
ncbi:MAG: hypothetical protein NTU53_09710 [Planctomycetota bacterium]|nr:hypothetical protein [Planctomycetota bacterium]